MGFCNARENARLLEEVAQTVSEMSDKSTIYANGGDRDIFIKVIERHGKASDDERVDCTTLNTPSDCRPFPATQRVDGLTHCDLSKSGAINSVFNRLTIMLSANNHITDCYGGRSS